MPTWNSWVMKNSEPMTEMNRKKTTTALAVAKPRRPK